MEGDDIMRGGVDGCSAVGDISSCVSSERWLFSALASPYASLLSGGDGILALMPTHAHRGASLF